MDKWHPKVRTGYFYVGDSQFYLFADKCTVWLDDITWYIYDTGRYVNQITQAKYGTYDIDTQSLKIEGNNILVNLSFLNPQRVPGYDTVNVYEHEIMLSYTYIDGGDTLQQTEVSDVVFHPSTSSRKYYLNPIPVSGPPVILTNFEVSSEIGDEYLHPQFSIDYDTGELSFLSYGMRNQLNNPLFNCYYESSDSSYPCDWLTQTDPVTLPFTLMRRGYIGSKSYLSGNIIAPDGIYTSITDALNQYANGDYIRRNWIYQEVPVTESQNMALSFYAKAAHPDVADIPNNTQVFMKILFLNSDGRYINSGGVYALGLNSMIEYYACRIRDDEDEAETVSREWTRHSLVDVVPEDAVRAAVFISVAGLAAIDAVQLEADEVSNFDPKSRNMLLEYEQSDAGVYTVRDVDLNPAHNLNNSGILQITNLQDPVRDQKIRPGEL